MRKKVLVFGLISLSLLMLFFLVCYRWNQPYRGESYSPLFPALKADSEVTVVLNSRPPAIYFKQGPGNWEILWNDVSFPARNYRLNLLMDNLKRVNRRHVISRGEEIFPLYGLTEESGTFFSITGRNGKIVASGIVGLSYDHERVFLRKMGDDRIYILEWNGEIPLTPYEMGELRLFPEWDTDTGNFPVVQALKIETVSSNADLSYVIIKENRNWISADDKFLLDQEKTQNMISSLAGLKGINAVNMPGDISNQIPPMVIQWILEDGRTLTARGWKPMGTNTFLIQREDNTYGLLIPFENLVEGLKPLSELKEPDRNRE